MTEIPELPLFRFIDCDGEWYKAEDMRSFYAQGVRAGMERAAAKCDRRETLIAAQADKIMRMRGKTDAWHFCIGVARGSFHNAAAIRTEAAKEQE